MKIAAFSGVFLDYSIHQAMAYTQELGLDGIEIACKEPHLSIETSCQRVEEIKNLSKAFHLKIPALAGYLGWFSTSSDKECEKSFSEFQQILKWANILESDMIRVFPGGPNAFLAADYHYEKAAYWLKKCAEKAKEYNKKIALEIHNMSLVETVEGGLKLLNKINEENVGLIHDAGNMYITDTDYGKDSVRKLGRHLLHVHVKDEKRIDKAGASGTFINLTKHGEEKFLQCKLGEGKVNHQPLFDALKEVAYDGWISLECASPHPPKERLAHDLKKVRQMLENVTETNNYTVN
ncbi:xylose isomerase [Heyndrickxia shackletonii]|uniref:Xylose isomerase n=1 Tax=Heyndrickxia shackletonii TaxID=157838 RepID=A0A0Q3WY19_9BACI|nr:sugar phosphate isomerase/epimerase [Heyndrickxia shackletonii]KQL54282.1 xylose isomerase [Heyndrickxia shackletonii]MBB2480140.1 sugar phosphate isomerase/epimerase [Bacillus sp. APMAM]NEZ01241.1 sugar phosphate isomerase/epimerase [Heyndrickxia shackletonii]RTZ56347.1 sugar phosphate isomerase/epimerase [Bacillus sp. SAJ1]